MVRNSAKRRLGEEEGSNWLLNGIFAVILIFLVALVIFTNVVSLCTVLGSSMNETFYHNENILLLKRASIRHGDVIVIDNISPEGALVKRAIALEGDKLVFKIRADDERFVGLYRKKKGEQYYQLMEEPYVPETMERSFMQGNFDFQTLFYQGVYRFVPAGTAEYEYDAYAITVEKDHVFFLGDNRNNSVDSRYYGTTHKKNLYGRMVFNKLKKGSFLEKVLLFIY